MVHPASHAVFDRKGDAELIRDRAVGAVAIQAGTLPRASLMQVCFLYLSHGSRGSQHDPRRNPNRPELPGARPLEGTRSRGGPVAEVDTPG